MTKDCVYAIPCSRVRIYKEETGRLLNMRLQDQQKTVTRGEVKKSGVAEHIWRENGDHRPLWDQVEIIDKEHNWRIRKNLLNRPSLEINTIWEPVIRSAREKQ